MYSTTLPDIPSYNVKFFEKFYFSLNHENVSFGLMTKWQASVCRRKTKKHP
jgi:hypothetical protein